MLAAPLESLAPMLPLAIVLMLAVVVLIFIAFDLRRLRRDSRLRPIHAVTGAAFTVVVIGGALAVSLALGSATTAIAEPADAPTVSTVPVPESINTDDVTDPSTDIQLPPLGIDEDITE